MFKPIEKFVKKELSAKGARREIYGIFKNDRIGTTPAFVSTADHIYKRLKQLGLKEVRKTGYLADGKTLIQDWLPSPAWDCKSASLKITEPKEHARTVVTFPEKFLCVGMNSSSTPKSGVESELILYKNSSDLKKARGKILFYPGRIDYIKKEIIENSILGIVSDYHYKGIKNDDTIYWENRWHVKMKETNSFCFKISMKDGAAIRKLLEKGIKLTVKANVNAKNYAGKMPAVSGVIPGTNPKEEVITFGHVYEVGAHDNASGTGLIMEVARVLQELIKTGKLPRPKRSIRFLFPHEMYGTLDWVANHRDKTRKLVAGLNLDMVGGKGLSLRLKTSDEIPSFSTELIIELLNQYPYIKKMMAISPGVLDDEMFLKDPVIGCPTPTLSHNSPEYCYHSDADDMDNLDYGFTKDIGVATAVYLYFIASAGLNEAVWLAKLVFGHWSNKISRCAKEKNAAGRINFFVERGIENLKSIAVLLEKSEQPILKSCIAGYMASLENDKRNVSVKEAVVKGERLVPVRLKGFLMLGMDCLTDEGKKEFQAKFKEIFPWSHYLTSLFYLTDGKRTVKEIHLYLKNNLGKSDLKRLVKIYRFLERTKYIKLV